MRARRPQALRGGRLLGVQRRGLRDALGLRGRGAGGGIDRLRAPAVRTFAQRTHAILQRRIEFRSENELERYRSMRIFQISKYAATCAFNCKHIGLDTAETGLPKFLKIRGS